MFEKIKFTIDVLYNVNSAKLSNYLADSFLAYVPPSGMTPDFQVILIYSSTQMKFLRIIDCKSLGNSQESVYDGDYFGKAASL